MAKKALPVLAAAALIAVLVVVLVPKRPERPEQLTPLSEEIRHTFGAAAYVPDDVSTYTCSMRIADQWTQIWESNAVQNLVRLPLVQQTWQRVQMHPMYMGLMTQLRTSPLFVQGLPVLKDAVSTEVFLCAGPGLPETAEAVLTVVSGVRMMSVRAAFQQPGAGPAGPDVAAIIDLVLQFEDQLRMPSILVGFKLTEKEAAQEFLDTWLPRIPPTPVGRVEKRTIRGAEFYVFELKGDAVAPQALSRLAAELARAGVPSHARRRFVAWLKTQRLLVALGVLDDYLMLSLGKDASLLDRWDSGSSLAASPAFEPIRKRHRPDLMSISYSSAKMLEAFSPTPEDVKATLEGLAEMIPENEKTAGLKDRLKRDIARLMQDADPPRPSSSLSFSFRNMGIESYGFGRTPARGLDCSEPLDILEHRGNKPILCAARHAAENPKAYDTAVKWLKTGFGYFEDYVVPTFEPGDREQYEKVMKLARPFLRSVDDATRECLIPATDGAQSLFVLDGGGTVARIPGGKPLPKPVPTPRIGLAMKLNDAEKFLEAMQRYADAVRKLIADAREAYPGRIPPQVKLPPPATEELAGGKLYYYRLPWDLGRDVFPCALLKGRLLVVASSSTLASEMAGAQPMPTCPVTDPEQAAGAVTIVNTEEAWSYLNRLSDAVFPIIQMAGPNRPQEEAMMMAVKMHLDAVWRSLGAIRSYTSTTAGEDGGLVRHSWLHVEDIAR